MIHKKSQKDGRQDPRLVLGYKSVIRIEFIVLDDLKNKYAVLRNSIHNLTYRNADSMPVIVTADFKGSCQSIIF